MPHYKDGTEALPGDIARGKGYNLPHEVQGVVIQVSPADTCNLIIAVPKLAAWGFNLEAASAGSYINMRQVAADTLVKTPDERWRGVSLDYEYGDIKEFELVYRDPKLQAPALEGA